MTIQIPYRWAKRLGLAPKDAYVVARVMVIQRGSFTDAMIAAGYWTAYRVWA